MMDDIEASFPFSNVLGLIQPQFNNSSCEKQVLEQQPGIGNFIHQSCQPGNGIGIQLDLLLDLREPVSQGCVGC